MRRIYQADACQVSLIPPLARTAFSFFLFFSFFSPSFCLSVDATSCLAFLHVDVAVGPGDGADVVAQRRGRRVEAEVHEVVDGGVGARRLVEDGAGAGDLEGAGGGVAQVLPDPPGPVDLAVVQPEERVVGAVEDVAARVAAPGEVPGRVQAEVAVREVALQPVLEGPDRRRVGRVREQRDRLLRRRG